MTERISRFVDVLIVDDEDDIRLTLQEVLEGDGYVVGCAINGQQALSFVETSKPAVILLDLMMPTMNGWAFLQARKASVWLLSIPVIVMSANLELINKDEIREYDRLAKPFDLPKLRALIAKWARRSEPGGSQGDPDDDRNERSGVLRTDGWPTRSADRVHVLGEDRGADPKIIPSQANGTNRRGL